MVRLFEREREREMIELSTTMNAGETLRDRVTHYSNLRYLHAAYGYAYYGLGRVTLYAIKPGDAERIARDLESVRVGALISWARADDCQTEMVIVHAQDYDLVESGALRLVRQRGIDALDGIYCQSDLDSALAGWVKTVP